MARKKKEEPRIMLHQIVGKRKQEENKNDKNKKLDVKVIEKIKFKNIPVGGFMMIKEIEKPILKDEKKTELYKKLCTTPYQ